MEQHLLEIKLKLNGLKENEEEMVIDVVENLKVVIIAVKLDILLEIVALENQMVVDQEEVLIEDTILVIDPPVIGPLETDLLVIDLHATDPQEIDLQEIDPLVKEGKIEMIMKREEDVIVPKKETLINLLVLLPVEDQEREILIIPNLPVKISKLYIDDPP
jgi:hypothetical protein